MSCSRQSSRLARAAESAAGSPHGTDLQAGVGSRLRVRQFDYVPLGERLAVLRLRVELASGAVPPSDALLRITRGPQQTIHPVGGSACETERGRRPWMRATEVWKACFAAPIDAVAEPGALFELLDYSGAPLTLGRPILRDDVTPEELRAWLPQFFNLRKAAALATAASITVASTPVSALAAAHHATVSPHHATVSAHHPTVSAHHATVSTRHAAVSVRPSKIERPVVVLRPHLSVKHRWIEQAGSTSQGQATSPTTTTTPGTATAPPQTTATSPGQPTAPGAPTATTLGQGTTPAPVAAKPEHGTAKSKHGTQKHKHALAPSAQAPAQQQPAGGPPMQVIVPPPVVHSAPEAKSSAPAPPQPHVRPAATPPPPPPPAPTTQTQSSDNDHDNDADDAGTSQLTLGPPVSASLSISGLSPREQRALAGEVKLLERTMHGGDQPPLLLVPIYKAAAHKYHISWKLLAAINSIETDYGRNLNVSSAGAIGWMQFMPSTWREWGTTPSGHGRPNPYSPRDAIFSAARYLAAAGARHNIAKAIFAYNHATWYVDEVLWKMRTIHDHAGTVSVRDNIPRAVAKVIEAGNTIATDPYIWGGGHASFIAPGYDCSGSVSYALAAAGLLNAPMVSGDFETYGKPGPGKWITIYANSGHVWMQVAGWRFDTVALAEFGTRWASSGGEFNGYVVRHPAGF